MIVFVLGFLELQVLVMFVLGFLELQVLVNDYVRVWFSKVSGACE